ncbi:hypothetical protein M9Y10_023857 [Tritrichomonas musculus]|uniref:Uncharacterized protein n=1 Tax=Tritrichomonas musculus TaxID=1915356 RepID=A0ABR2KWC7_9EUKA
MLVCGYNSLFQLGEQANNKNANGSPINSPPCKSHLNISSLLSFSSYWDNSIWITEDGDAYAVGSNCFGQISVSIPKKTLLKDTKVYIGNKSEHRYKFLSAVCGEYYTLYQVADERSPNHSKLVYMYRYKVPLFLNISGRIPKKLYGGKETAAVIDTEGSILIITKSVLSSPKVAIEPISLSDNDRAVKVACCDEFVLALSAGGKLFEYSLINPGQRKFMEVSELKGLKFTDVSGTFFHCFAVTCDGRVLGRGPNDCCQLGLKKDVKSANQFIPIDSLKKFKIQKAFAGCSHSLFLTIEGKVIVCGKNYYGELMLLSGPSREYVYPPVEAAVTGNATFCFAGCCTSFVLVDTEVPANCPNMKIEEFVRSRDFTKSAKKSSLDAIVEEEEVNDETLTEVFDVSIDTNEEITVDDRLNEEEEEAASPVNKSDPLKDKERQIALLKLELALAKKEIAILNQKNQEIVDSSNDHLDVNDDI